MRRFEGGHNLTHQVCNDLGLDIVKGKYDSDMRLPTEALLSGSYEVSRSVMREAVKMLTAKGLITSRPRQGIKIQSNEHWNMFDSDVLSWTLNSRPSLEILREFTQLRIGIEPEAAALAAMHHRPEDIGVIEGALTRMKIAEMGDESLLADIDFHKAILQASQNRFFIQLQGFIETALRVSITHTNKFKQVTSADHSDPKQVLLAAWQDHKKVLDAIRKGNAKKASILMRALLVEALALIEGALEAGKES